MVRIQNHHSLLSQIRGARNYSEQAAALRALKDEVVGHVQQKEAWVERGVPEIIVKILQNARSPAKLNGKEARGHGGGHLRSLTDEEIVRLQALQLLASFAKGASLLVPVRTVDAVPAILSNIVPLDNPPQVVLAALRAFSNITDAARLSSQASDDANALAEILFAPRNLGALLDILTSHSTSSVLQHQKRLVCGLISQLCKDTQHQNALANAGVLDAVATMLASFVVRRGEVVPGAELQDDGLADLLPDPAPQGASLEDTLEAISAIIEDSRFRAYMLLSSPAIMAVFPDIEFTPVTKELRSVWNTLEMVGLSSLRAKPTGAVDYLLPALPVNQPKGLTSQHSHFPPLSSSLTRDVLLRSKTTAWEPGSADTGSPNSDGEADDGESPLIPWLIHLVRSTTGLTRVLAASVLASLVKVGLASPERETTIALLVIPVLCQLMKEQDKEKEGVSASSTYVRPCVATNWAILERTPAVLARFVADSEYLQQTANDCGAIKTVCKLLKDSYEPVPDQVPARPWSPTPDQGPDRGEGSATSQVGPRSRLPSYSHKIKTRESSLKFIAAMSSFKEELRKAIVEQGAVPYVVESLAPFPSNPKLGKEKPKADEAPVGETGPRTGGSHFCDNTNAVIIAACHVIRTLSRSIGILRTYLEDYKVAIPLLKLLKHHDPAVQVAACGAVCNLVSEVSPMRGLLVEAGIVKILCDHAHSLNPGLRLNAMWALKHLVHAVDNDLKKRCLEQLEPGWLIQLIVSDTEDEALHARLNRRHGMADDDDDDGDDNDDDIDDDDNNNNNNNNNNNSNDGDEEMDGDGYEDESRPWVWPAVTLFTEARLTPHRNLPARMQQAERKLATLRETELNPVRKARNDDLAIQEQGLNFIRNLLGPGSSGSGQEASSDMMEMVDFVFNELGQDRLFQILGQKLRVKVLHPFARRHSSGPHSDTRVLYPQAKIIEAVVYILVHMAASIPRHRQLVIAQTELLRQLGGCFSSKDVDVRRALCHLLTNLVWQDDDQDAGACAQRTAELKRLGFLAKLESLELADGELDIRERAKAAVWQMKKAS